jgi:hypothetical protein
MRRRGGGGCERGGHQLDVVVPSYSFKKYFAMFFFAFSLVFIVRKHTFEALFV